MYTEIQGKRKLLLLSCIFFSLLLHALAISFLQKHSLWFYSERKSASLSKIAPKIGKKIDFPLKTSWKKKSSLSSSELPAKEQDREILFSMELLKIPENTFSPRLSNLQERFNSKNLCITEIAPSFSHFQPKPELHTEILKSISHPLTPIPLKPLKKETLLFSQEITKEILLPKISLPVQERKETEAKLLSLYLPQEKEKLLCQEEEPFSPPIAEEKAGETFLGNIPTLQELDTASLGECFDTELVFLPHSSEEGFIFALTLIPKPDVPFQQLRQHVYFLIDKANAIQKNRLKTTLNAVQKAISLLEDKDLFNLIAYDGKFERMSGENVPPSREHKASAKEFIHKLQLGNFFSTADPYKPLQALLYENLPHEDLATIVLITNGEGISNQNKQSFFIHQWTNQNAGRFSLFSLAMQGDKNIALLDLMSSLNKGKLYTTPTFQGIKRRLLKLVKSLRFPIAKDIACSVITRNSTSQVKLYPSFQQMPALFKDQPFVLMGTTKNLDDFILFMQGKQKEGWLNIKKTISFAHAKEADPSLAVQWAVVKSQYLFEKYMREGDPQYLIQAHALLEKHHLPAAL